MCGISGIVNNQGIDPLSIKKMTDVIQHRGPDDEGFLLITSDNEKLVAGGRDTVNDVWTYKSSFQPKINISHIKNRKIKVALGHRRLSILDLSPAGHQPMSYADGRYWIILNGEIYNFIELKKELISLGYKFNSKSDTEVVLGAWQEWGVGCQSRFNGMWAFVIYDFIKKEIFLSRDRFGIKPLYYWFAPDGSFCFGSEIKQFTTFDGWHSEINPQRAYDYLVYSYTDHTEETMFSGVYQIPGGYYFKSGLDPIRHDHSGKLQLSKWYDLEPVPFKGTFDEASIQFQELFQSSINLHTRADVPVGSALSGGLDSSAIVCEINNILKGKGVAHFQKTFSSCSEDERYNEKKWMDIVVGHTNVDAHFVYPRWENLFPLTSDLIWFQDEPYQSQSVFLGYHVFKSARLNNVIVLLNGQGADEYLGGYGQFTMPRLVSLARQLKLIKLLNEVSGSGSFTNYPFPFAFKIIFSSILPESIRSFRSDHVGLNRLFKGLIDCQKLGSIERNPNKDIPVSLRTVKDISKHGTFYSTLPKYLRWEDRNSMANSVEARVPFLDYRLVEFSYSLPDDFLDFKGETKRILRQGLKRILPERIMNRKDKKGFITPEERWVKEDNTALFRTKISESIESTNGIIKNGALTFFDKMVADKIPFNFTYWRLILFAEWIKIFNVKLK